MIRHALLLAAALAIGCSREEARTAPPATAPSTPRPPTRSDSDAWGLPGKGPHLVAHYVPWFTTARPGGGWSHWSWAGGGPKSDPDVLLATGKRQIASRYYPLIGPYESASPQVIRYHLATMKAAGIEIVLALWYGPGSQTDKVIPLLLDEAAHQDMKLAICYEEKLGFPPYRRPQRRGEVTVNATADLRYILQTYSGHGAYLAYRGRPVIMQFNSVGASEIGPSYLTTSEWREVLSALPRPVLYVRQNLDLAYHPPIDGAYLWFSRESRDRLAFARSAAKARSDGRLQVMLSAIAPGFDDSGVFGWGEGPRITPRNGNDILDATMRDATEGDPDLIQLVTWNDFNEGTNIEPSVESGFAYLDAIETWYGQVTGRPVDLDDNRVPLAQYLRSADPEARKLIPPEASTVR